jgi:GT2 family glycosyltransferase
MLISLVIRTLNEARHLGDLLDSVAGQVLEGPELPPGCRLAVETVVIDSGSTDGTVEIARRHGARVTTIRKADFSFGRSLNRGSEFARGDILVYVSGHCIPVDAHWLRRLCAPLIAGVAVYSYGGQVGDETSQWSERRIFAKYFPPVSAIPQAGFFCNNANSALLRSAWDGARFDEELTGLEDMELAKRLVARGMRVAYVAEAAVYHLHAESWPQVRRRFEREAIALRAIMPEVHLSRLDVARFVVASVIADWRAARRAGVRAPLGDMIRYRWNQFVGSWKGNHEHRKLSRAAKERFFYPIPDEQRAQTDDRHRTGGARALRRAAPDEGQQPKGEGQELPSARRQAAVPVDS